MRSKVIFLALLAFTNIGVAHNNLFFPGDSFFSARWEQDFSLPQDVEQITLEYSRLSKIFMACGYAGCWKIKISGISEKTRKNLGRVHKRLFGELIAFATTRNRRLKNNAPPIDSDPFATTSSQQLKDDKPPKEVKFFPVLIYNKDFDFTKLPIGLRFNENWNTLQTKDAKREHAIYDGPNDRNLVVIDWSESTSVAPLKLKKQPESLEAFMGVGTPVEGLASDYVFVIPLSPDVWKVAKGVAGLRFIVVGDTITEYVCTKSGIKVR